MKSFLFSTLFVLGIIQCFGQNDSLPITVSLKLDRKYSLTYSKTDKNFAEDIKQGLYLVKGDSLKQNTYDISVELKNNSKNKIKIWLLSCSWENNFIVNNDYIFIKKHSCNMDVLTLLEINGGESKIYKGTLVKSLKFDYPCEFCIHGPPVSTTKLGIVLIDNIFEPKLGVIDYYIDINDKSKWKIIWSNSINLLLNDQ